MRARIAGAAPPGVVPGGAFGTGAVQLAETFSGLAIHSRPRSIAFQ